VGPTASGKTQAGVVLAERLGAEVLSVDSMAVYRGMNIGTAKPHSEQRARVRHHLLDVAEPGEAFSVARYQQLAREALHEIGRRRRRALLVGGSGLYFRAVVDELEFPGTDPETRDALHAEAAAVGPVRLHERLRSFDATAADRIEPKNARRTIRALEVAAVTGRPFSSYAAAWDGYPQGAVRAAGVDVDPAILRRRIEARVHRQLRDGFLEEVRRLMDRGAGPLLTSGQAIGYAEMVAHLEGRMSLDEAVGRTTKRTRALARRQLSWFRRDPRIIWFRTDEEGATAIVDELAEYLDG
jgi:tRNA dimethylallyltransferase